MTSTSTTRKTETVTWIWYYWVQFQYFPSRMIHMLCCVLSWSIWKWCQLCTTACLLTLVIKDFKQNSTCRPMNLKDGRGLHWLIPDSSDAKNTMTIFYYFGRIAFFFKRICEILNNFHLGPKGVLNHLGNVGTWRFLRFYAFQIGEFIAHISASKYYIGSSCYIRSLTYIKSMTMRPKMQICHLVDIQRLTKMMYTLRITKIPILNIVPTSAISKTLVVVTFQKATYN